MASMTPDFLNKIMFWRREDPDRKEETRRGKWNNIADEIRKIIIWDNPIKSLACLVGVNVLFWFIINIKLKFYGLVFISLLVVTVNQLWNEQIQRTMTAVDTDSGRDSATPGSSSNRFSSEADVNSGLEMVRSAFMRLKRLRQEHRGMFCAGACVSFLMLSFIGRTISGATLLYVLLTAVMIVPGILIRAVPPHVLNSLKQFIYSSHKGTESGKAEAEAEEEEDYIPETSEEDLELLRLASDLEMSRRDDDDSRDILLEQITGRTNDTTESSYSKLSFYPESSIPGVDESSLDFLEFELTGEKASQSRKSGNTDDSDSDINFQSKHFNGDTSDEEEFAKGLKFKDVAEKDDTIDKDGNDGLPGLLNAASAGLNLLSAGANILATAVVKSSSPPIAVIGETKRHDRESSSDTDSFELISEEDI